MLIKRWRLFGVVGLVLVLSLGTVGIALALASSTVDITGYTPSADCSYFELHGSLFNNDPSVDLYLDIENLTRGGTKQLHTSDLVINYSGICVWCGFINPAGTQAGDIVRYNVSWKDDSLNVLDSDTLTVNCSTGEVYHRPKPDAPYTGINLLSNGEQAPYLSVPNADGATPCGVFDVNGWGAKYVGMGDFPGCTAPVTVMCLNGDGEWTGDTVSDVVMHGDWEVDFISSQDGTCGLFEQ